jgi:hypothetical protein
MVHGVYFNNLIDPTVPTTFELVLRWSSQRHVVHFLDATIRGTSLMAEELLAGLGGGTNKVVYPLSPPSFNLFVVVHIVPCRVRNLWHLASSEAPSIVCFALARS